MEARVSNRNKLKFNKRDRWGKEFSVTQYKAFVVVCENEKKHYV